MERAMGIEPTSKAWEAFILPMNYARAEKQCSFISYDRILAHFYCFGNTKRNNFIKTRPALGTVRPSKTE